MMAYITNFAMMSIMQRNIHFSLKFLPALSISKRLTSCKPVPAGIASGNCAAESKEMTGVVLGVYSDPEGTLDAGSTFTPTAETFNLRTNGMLDDLLKRSGPPPQRGEVRVFYDLESNFAGVAVVGLGVECAGYDDTEVRDEEKEAIRIAAGNACMELQELNYRKVSVEGFGHSESAAEGAALATWIYQELKDINKRVYIPQLDLYDNCDWISWRIGLHKAAAQNLTRQLMDTPANMMTPTTFAQNAVEVLCKSGVNIEVKVQAWAETQKMGAFLEVAKGSCEPAIFLELSYYGTDYDSRPVVLVGSGITFDSGGVCLKNSRDMVHMRADMNGAACVVATIRAIAELQIPINVRGLIPLCENMPGCSAMKPGDIVTAMNGKKILIEDTNCDGRLIMADTLHYSQIFWPRFVVDIGSLTKDIRKSVGASATGVFTNSDDLWRKIKISGMHTGDRMWRFPLWDFFSKQILETKSTDIKNMGRGDGGGACRAAAFLREFMPCGEWMHLDTFGVMRSNGIDYPYIRYGMSGRPTRTLVEFLAQLACVKCD